MRLSTDLGQLTYCTNIHAGETLDEILDSLQDKLPGIRSGLGSDGPFGVGLRLGGQAVDALQSPTELERVKSFLRDGDYYVFTLNGFPYGPFHGQSVKDGAYRPDWTDPVRLEYTNRLADILAELLPAGVRGSISTVPGTFKPWAETAGAVEKMAENLVRHVCHLVGIHGSSGQDIALALEPEPYCYLETIDESIQFFEQYLFGGRAIRQVRQATGLSDSAAEQALRRHLGICLDVCHAAVEFEDPGRCITDLRNAGIGIDKLQLSSALRLAPVTADGLQALRRFDEPVYLHQVVQQRNGQLTRFSDIAPAMAQRESAMGSEWRVHFHVPVFLSELPEFGTTQAFLADVLQLHQKDKISDHLEVETYTWDVLPANLRSAGVDQAIAREMGWVMEQLGINNKGVVQ